MRDPRVERLAELITGYSLELRPGQLLRIDSAAVAEPLIVALHRAALRLGANAYANVELDGIAELLVEQGTEEQLTFVSPIEWRELDFLDAQVTIWSETNTRSFTGADPLRHQRLIAAERQLANKRWERIDRGELSWCGTLFPTNAHA